MFVSFITSSCELSHQEGVEILPPLYVPFPADRVVDTEEDEGGEGDEDEDEPEPELEGLEHAVPLVTAFLPATLPEWSPRAVAGVEADQVGLMLGVCRAPGGG